MWRKKGREKRELARGTSVSEAGRTRVGGGRPQRGPCGSGALRSGEADRSESWLGRCAVRVRGEDGPSGRPGLGEKKERARREGGVGLGQAVSWVGLGFGVFFFSFPFLILIQTKLNLFEFKFEFEFKRHSIK